MRMKKPPQPLLFRFDGPTTLCEAVQELYRLDPGVSAALCLWQGKYHLLVAAGLRGRKRLAQALRRYGTFLGASPVLYAFCREHGQEITRDAVARLGAVLEGAPPEKKKDD